MIDPDKIVSIEEERRLDLYSSIQLQFDLWGKIAVAAAMALAASVGVGLGPYIPLPF